MSSPPGVMLLAAGRGVRMAPLTDTLPKPLIEVAGRPLIDRTIDTCTAQGCRSFVVNVHAHAGKMRSHIAALQARHPELRLQISDETDALLETGGGMKKALPLLGTDPVLAANTDSFWLPGDDAPLVRMIAVMDKGFDVVMLVADIDRASGFRGSADLALDGNRVLPPDAAGFPGIYAGRALIRRSAFEDTPMGAFSLYSVFQAAGRSGLLGGVLLDADWLHVGDPGAIVEAEARLAGR